MDIRELIADPEETLRTVFAGLMRNSWTAMPVRLVEDSKDGHVVALQPTIKREATEPETGESTYQDHPTHTDVPISHTGGGGVSHTFPSKTGDTGMAVYASRPLDSWFQSDATQQPIDNRQHSLADGMFVSGIRSVVRKLQQVDPDATQLRSDDKRHVISHHPETGTHIKSADPSTPPASVTFDPFKQATKYLEHLVQGASGLFHRAVDGATKHNYSLTHDAGHVMDVVNGLHSVLTHPSNGASLNAANLLHTVLAHPINGASLNASNLLHQVLAHPSLGALLSAANGQHMVHADPNNGVILSSPDMIALNAPSVTAPAGSFSGSALSGASVSAAALGSGAAASNVGNLGGDLSGTLPNPNVVGISHVTKGNLLPNFANDSAASAGHVPIGGLYRNGSVLMTRVT